MRTHFVLVSRESAAKSWIAVGVLALAFSACGGDNESLFNEVPAPTKVDLILPPPDVSEPVDPAPPPTSETPDDSDEDPDEELPVDPGEDDDDGDDDEDPPITVDPPEDPLPPEEPPPNPTVIAVSPEDGATSVSNDTSIVITFSEPMNPGLTEQAYQSEGIPSNQVSFSWNEDNTELTVTPNQPLEYDSGSDPALVEARRFSFFLSSSAEDLDGNPLAGPQEFSFSLLRQIEMRFFAVQDRNLTGSYRSNNTYGSGDCARNAINMCVGDQRIGGDNEQYKGFITFDLTSLPVGDMTRLSSARLNLQITGTSGNPFGGLGGLFLEHADFDLINEDAFEAQPRANMGMIASAGNLGTVLSVNVLPAVEVDANERLVSQYRFSFEDETDNDFNADAIISAWNTQTLDVSFLVP